MAGSAVVAKRVEMPGEHNHLMAEAVIVDSRSPNGFQVCTRTKLSQKFTCISKLNSWDSPAPPSKRVAY
jgi:hypothetical protein